MDMKTKPSARIEPLPPQHTPGLADAFEGMRKNLGFIPNSMLILQRKPKIVRAIRALSSAVFDPEGEVSVGFKRLLAYVVAHRSLYGGWTVYAAGDHFVGGEHLVVTEGLLQVTPERARHQPRELPMLFVRDHLAQVRQRRRVRVADREVGQTEPHGVDVHGQLGKRGRPGQQNAPHQQPAQAGQFGDRIGEPGERGQRDDQCGEHGGLDQAFVVLVVVAVIARLVSRLHPTTAACVKAGRVTAVAVDLVTVVAPLIGYDRAARVAKKAMKSGRGIKDIIIEEEILPKEKIDSILDPKKLAGGGRLSN